MMAAMPLLLALLLACTSPPPREGGGGAPVGHELARVQAAGVSVWVERVADGTVLWVDDGREVVPRIRHGAPDRPALDPSGQWLAYVASADGLPAVFVAPVAGGPSRQLTNEALVRRKGSPPEGFVPPPVTGDGLRFVGDELRWEAEGRTWRVTWSSR
jgi:hypothetical protein